MLSSPTPFPYVGSYALFEHDGAHTLARIVMRREGELVIGLPTVDGASGNLRVTPDRLIDATPLTAAETREFHDLDRQLAGRSPDSLRRSTRLKAMIGRRDALKRRLMHAPVMDRLLREARQRGLVSWDAASQAKAA